ncbi:MAG: hypothetical protein A2X86_11315 [Bdellovibrionales bacterium GWA2_49_15]|nr:MAG: hypothetical protein A2X86_11315 [Bdellovibrionales bacterium GWA2_49_15]
MKKLSLYACVASLFYLQLAMPFLTFNIFPTVMAGTAYAADTCDEAQAKSMGTSCAEIKRIQEDKAVDCAALLREGQEAKAKQDSSGSGSGEASDQNEQDAATLKDQFTAIKQEEAGSMVTSDILTGIVFLAIGVVSVYLGMSCVKGTCGAGTVMAAIGAVLYFVGEIVGMVGYNSAMSELGATQDQYLKCEKAQGISRKKEDDTSGTAELTGEEFETQTSQLTLDEKKVIDTAQFAALDKQRKSLATIRDYAIGKAVLQGAASVAFLIAMTIEIVTTVKDNGHMTAAWQAYASIARSSESCVAGYTAPCAVPATAAANCPYVTACSICWSGANFSWSDIATYQVHYNTIWSNATCVESTYVLTTEIGWIESLDAGAAVCALPYCFWAPPLQTTAHTNMKAVTINLAGHKFPNCAAGCGPCRIVDSSELFTPMNKEQKATLETKNLAEKILGFLIPEAQASSGGDWVKGIGLTAMVLIVLLGILSGFTSLADSFITRPPQRIVLFSVISALALAAFFVTTAVAVEMGDRIDKMDAILGKWKEVGEGSGSGIGSGTGSGSGSGSGSGTGSGSGHDPAEEPPTPPAAPTPTPTPPPAGEVIDSLDWGVEFRNFASDDEREKNSPLGLMKSWITKVFKSSIEEARAGSPGMAVTLPGNRKFPCISKEEGGNCTSQSKSQLEALAKIPGLPDIILQQGNRAILLAKAVSGQRGLSVEAMNLARSMTRDLSKTKTMADKMEKMYDEKRQEDFKRLQETRELMAKNYNAMSDEEKEKVDPKFLTNMRSVAEYKPAKLKDDKLGLLNKMKKIAQGALNKLSASARANLNKSGFFSMGVDPMKIERKQTSMNAKAVANKPAVVDGGFETTTTDNTDPSIAKNLKRDNNDGIDDLDVTVDDINKGQEISIFQLISQRYRRIYNITE